MIELPVHEAASSHHLGKSECERLLSGDSRAQCIRALRLVGGIEVTERGVFKVRVERDTEHQGFEYAGKTEIGEEPAHTRKVDGHSDLL